MLFVHAKSSSLPLLRRSPLPFRARPPSDLLCLLPPPLPVLTAMKRGRDNARVEEISPRFYPRHRFEGSTATVVSPNLPRSRILVISDGGTNFPSPSLFSFFFPRFFSPRRVDKNFAKPFRARIERCEYALDKFAELYISAATFEFSRVIPHRRMVN